MDETYQTYVNRVTRLTLPATYDTQLQNIQKSPKFQNGQPISFPGYTIITPPYHDDSFNRDFYGHLESVQQQLLEKLPLQFFISVPPSSFHLTVADLIWDKSYQEAVRDRPNFDEKLKESIRDSFRNHKKSHREIEESQWQILGLLVFPRALAVGLVPDHEQSYNHIVNLRRSIYQNSDLMALGIEQQYYFTPHITLGYFGEIPEHLERDRLVSTFLAFNDKWLETEPQNLKINRVELRKFEDMTRYEREENDPSIVI